MAESSVNPRSIPSESGSQPEQAESAVHPPAEPASLPDPFIFDGLPADPQGDEFQKFVFGAKNRERPPWDTKATDHIANPKEADSSESYTSYGENGTTASVSTDGSLIQITRFLGVGRSGFFSLDQNLVPEPWFVQERQNELMERSSINDGITLYCQNQSPEEAQAFESGWKRELVYDRWPRFVSKPTDDFTMIAQHFVSNGTIFLRWRYETKTEKRIRIISNSDLFFHLDSFLIRELEFTDPSYMFNELQSNHSYTLGPYGRSAILSNMGVIQREASELKASCSDIAGLVIAISVNGEIQELENDRALGPASYRIRHKTGQGNFSTIQSKPLEVTMALKLQLMPKLINWKRCLIADSEFLAVDNAFTKTTSNSFTKLQFLEDTHLDFIMRRNLEHILSVCSIPVPDRPSNENQPADGVHKNDKPDAWRIALTCGDMSGHRLVTSASFFAFQFLLSMFEHLGDLMIKKNDGFVRCEAHTNKSENNYTIHHCNNPDGVVCQWEYSHALRSRVKATCEAHLSWIIDEVELSEDGCFGANYWATGKIINDESRGYLGRDVLNNKSLTDAPFQIIKLADFATKFKDNNAKWVKELEKRITHWVKRLDDENTRKFAFPRPIDEAQDTQEYRLEDHVWIWRALQSTEKLGLGKKLLKYRESKKPKEAGESQATELKENYSSAEFQRQVLSRFTIENDVSKQRMIAVTRSISENRFQFRSRHTALFYEAAKPFFIKSETLWKATIEVQKFHTKNQDSRWNKPLRYALALVMGSNNSQINSMLPQEMVKLAKKVLLESCSGSGIFPGHLNVDTKEPVMYPPGWGDFYWHTSFELPYLLWENNAMATKISLKGNAANQTAQDMSAKVSSAGISIGNKSLEMKSSIPFNKLIDQKSIIELSDEWLFTIPDFLGFPPPTRSDTKTGTGDVESNPDRDTSAGTKSIMSQVREACPIKKSSSSFKFPDELDHIILRGVIRDISRKDPTQTRSRAGPVQNPEDSGKWLSNLDMYNQLMIPRIVEKAKKRLFWLPNADLVTSGLCCLKSPESERVYLSTFFNRHNRKEKYFFDETIAVMNIWKTEFHLSSYQIMDQHTDNGDLRFLGGNKTIRRAGMGFRFIGDFWDRYWTCHVLEYEPKEDSKREKLFQRTPSDKTTFVQDRLESFKELLEHNKPQRSWCQRKVLELLLFDLMLKKINGRYSQLLGEIDQKLWEEAQSIGKSLLPAKPVNSTRPDILYASNALFSLPMNNDSYSSFSKQWPAFQYTLQVMEEDLEETLEKIELWRNREKDRQLERPRWTRDDERKYRSVLNKVTISNNHKIRDLERYLASIRSLRTSLTSRLESTRNELSFQSAENVRFFTYVTVIFLPLGFATAVFSTSGVPSAKPVGYIIATAFITLLFTAIALANAPFLDDHLFRPVFHFFRLGRRHESQESHKPKNGSTEQENAGKENSANEQDSENLPPENQTSEIQIPKKQPPEGPIQEVIPFSVKSTLSFLSGIWDSMVKSQRRLLGKEIKEEARNTEERQLEEGKSRNGN